MAKKSRASSLQLNGKQVFSHSTLVLLVVLGIALIGMSRAGNPGVTRLRSAITDMVAPILGVAASPMDVLYNAGTWVAETAKLRAENMELKNQNIQLLQWQAAAKQMESDNKSLQSLLNVVPSRKNSYITVRVVADMGGPYVHSALLGGGSVNGIKKDQAVIGATGLLGRVVDVGMNSARVLLLNDINSRVPVITESSSEKSILVGNNNDLPTLSYLSADTKIEVGERLVTSGDGGIFPRGIPVGIVTSVEKGVVKVQPFMDPAMADYVSVVDYSI